MIELKLNEYYILEGRVYKIEWSKWENGKKQGNRAILRLLTSQELNNLIIAKGEQDLK